MKTKITHLLGAALSLLIPIGLSNTTIAAPQVYDLNSEWSDFINPNGVWTYRAGATVMEFSSSAGAVGVPGWVGPDGYLPVWFKYQGEDFYDFRTGEVYVHSANSDEEGVANIIWKAPSAGAIDISGSAWFGAGDHPSQADRNSIWSLWVNGILLTSGQVAWGDVYDFNSPFLFSTGTGGAGVLQNISVSVGDELMLQVRKESGPYGTFVGINLSVTLTPESVGPVDPVVAIEALAIAVFEMNLQNGIENSLDSKLDTALNALIDVNVSNDGAAYNSLTAFINAVEAQRGNKITTQQADQLINAAQQIQALLQ
jgi:hypothetical protein